MHTPPQAAGTAHYSVHIPPPGGRHGAGPAVLASAYVSEAGRVAVALANWAPHAVTVRHTHYGPHTYLFSSEARHTAVGLVGTH